MSKLETTHLLNSSISNIAINLPTLTSQMQMKMKLLATTVMSFSLLALVHAQAGQTQVPSSRAQAQEVRRNGSQPSTKGPAENFTGSVRVDPLFSARDSSSVTGGSVTFEPGARTAWHTHPVGQHLIVTAGVGRTQQWGGSVEEIKPGDVVWCPPGVKHWHGASPNTAMTHIAITGTLKGENVRWLEKVSDEQYNSR